jgi:hypothetical protein
MRKVIGLVLVALGVALFALGFALRLYVYPRVAVAPASPREAQVAEGDNITLLQLRGFKEGGPRLLDGRHVTVTRYVTGETVSGAPTPTGDQRFYHLGFSAVIDGVSALQYYTEGGLATNCCGDYLKLDNSFTSLSTDARPPVTHQGLMFKFPFNTQRKDYPFWDANIGKAAMARFDGTEQIKGMLTYRFVQSITDTPIGTQELPASLLKAGAPGYTKMDDIYADTRTMWVEPNTGSIIKGSEQLNRRFLKDGQSIPVISGYFVYNDKTITHNVNEYRSAALGLQFLRSYGPIGGWVLGPVLFAVGVTLLVMSRRQEEEWDDIHQEHGSLEGV